MIERITRYPSMLYQEPWTFDPEKPEMIVSPHPDSGPDPLTTRNPPHPQPGGGRLVDIVRRYS